MRVMTWNIKTGGYDRGGADRLDAIGRVVAAERPDLLAVQELRDAFVDSRRRLRRLAEATGMVPVTARSLLGQPVAVFARGPVRKMWAATWQLHHAAVAATVRTDRGDLTLVSAHLNPFSPQRRYREARWLAHRVTRWAPLAMLAGDLNALDPDTDHTDRLARLAPLFRRRHLAADGTADTRAIAAVVEAGLVDLWRTAGTGAGLTAPTSAGGGREFSGMRLDYLFGTPAVAVRTAGCRVVTGGEAESASDHYPVVADLDL